MLRYVSVIIYDFFHSKDTEVYETSDQFIKEQIFLDEFFLP